MDFAIAIQNTGEEEIADYNPIDEPYVEENLEINIAEDNLETVVMKLKAKIDLQPSEKIVLSKKENDYVNQFRDSQNNTLLMICVIHEKRDILKFLLQCEPANINAKNEKQESAADIAYKRCDHDSFLALLEADSLFPQYFNHDQLGENVSSDLAQFLENRKTLHEGIVNGKLDVVEKTTKECKPSLFLSSSNQSALSHAAERREIEIFAYLQYLGARFRDNTTEEENAWYNLGEGGLKEVKSCMNNYYEEPENAHVLKLMSVTKVVGSFKSDLMGIIEKLYTHISNSIHISLIMRVLKNEDQLDVVFDFDSEVTDRVAGCHDAGTKIFGLADGIIQRVYIGAKGEYKDGMNKNTAGILAHELCHLAMRVLYNNDAKPYAKDDTKRESDFKVIVDNAEKMNEMECPKVVKSVFGYNKQKQHAEMIVRVPQIQAIEGDSRGETILKEVKDLYDYFRDKVAKDCATYLNKVYFVKPLLITKYLHKYIGYLPKIGEGKLALKKPVKDYKQFLIAYNGLNILRSSNVMLGCSNLYQALNEEYKFHFEKSCMFFEVEIFQQQKKHREEILNALKSKGCHYLVLVTRSKEVDFDWISNHFKKPSFKEKKVLIVVDLKCTNPFNEDKDMRWKWENTTAQYEWNDLTDQYKDFIMKKKVNFQGYPTEMADLFDSESASEILPPDVLSYAIDEENIIIGDVVSDIP